MPGDKLYRIAALSLSLALLAGCSELAATFRKGQPPAPVYSYGQGGAGSAGMHSVAEGDTLWSISQRYALSVQDIIRVNHLQPPYQLVAGDRLSLPPPATYRVRANDSLYGISRTFNVSLSELARQNNLSSPYAVNTGEVLRLPSPRVAAAPPPLSAPRQASVSSSAPEPGYSAVRTAPAGQQTASVYAPPVEKQKPVTKVPARAGTRFAWPVDGPIISGYGPKPGGLHNDGINIRAARGTKVRAADNGVVAYAGNQLKGFGNLVLVRHDDRWMTAYAHLQTVSVTRGQELRQGAVIGTVGATGSVSEPQLHFEVRRGTDALNPALYLARPGS